MIEVQIVLRSHTSAWSRMDREFYPAILRNGVRLTVLRTDIRVGDCVLVAGYDPLCFIGSRTREYLTLSPKKARYERLEATGFRDDDCAVIEPVIEVRRRYVGES